VVVKIKDDSSIGGSSIQYDPYNNFVLIRHDDARWALLPLAERWGLREARGASCGWTADRAFGHTGFSSGPHLHFSVFKAKDGRERVSIPVKFRTSDGQAVTLEEGRRYKSPEVETARGPAMRAEARPHAVVAQ